MKSSWEEALVLRADRTVSAGSEAALSKAIERAARHQRRADCLIQIFARGRRLTPRGQLDDRLFG